MIKSIITLLRPKHWLKNIFVFLPLLFSNELTDIYRVTLAIGAFLSFCFVASSIYAFNDVLDIEYDKKHQKKKNRPIASGDISKQAALIVSASLLLLGFLLASVINIKLSAIILIYLIINLLYTTILKNIVILDVMLIASGYVLRMFAGASVSSQEPSHWIIMTTFFLALFLGFAKRRTELASRSEDMVSQRMVLREYSESMLDHILASTMAVTIICYSLYASSEYVVMRFGTGNFIYTIPFVVFGVFHYFQRVKIAKEGEDPAEVLIKDKPTLINLLLWAAVCIFIIYR